MIERLKRRAAKANLLDRIDTRVTTADTMGIRDLAGKVDFTLAFAMLHEFPDPGHFFSEVAQACRQNASILLAEPRGHVGDKKFALELEAAVAKGFRVGERPTIRRSLAALLLKN